MQFGELNRIKAIISAFVAGLLTLKRFVNIGIVLTRTALFFPPLVRRVLLPIVWCSQDRTKLGEAGGGLCKINVNTSPLENWERSRCDVAINRNRGNVNTLYSKEAAHFKVDLVLIDEIGIVFSGRGYERRISG